MTAPQPTADTVARRAAALGITPEHYARVLTDALITAVRERVDASQTEHAA